MSTPTATSASKGLEGVVAAQTRLSDVKGDIGQLIYCGYDINELAGHVSYEEVVHLLWHNRLPNAFELDRLTTALRAERELPKGVVDFIVNAPKTAAPIDICMKPTMPAAVPAACGRTLTAPAMTPATQWPPTGAVCTSPETSAAPR